MRLLRHILKRFVLVVVGAAVVATALFLMYQTPARPWEASGRLVVLSGSALDSTATSTFSFSVDDLALVSPDGRRTLTVRSRRVTLNPHNEHLSVLLDTEAPSGNYRGLALALKSPALTSLTNETPAPFTLQREHFTLPVSCTVVENDTTVIILRFETHATLRATTTGMVYLPTLQVEVRSGASVEILEGDRAKVEGGTIVTSLLFGMDGVGNMRINYREPNQLPFDAVEPDPSREPATVLSATTTPEDANTATSSESGESEDKEPSDESTTTASSS